MSTGKKEASRVLISMVSILVLMGDFKLPVG